MTVDEYADEVAHAWERRVGAPLAGELRAHVREVVARAVFDARRTALLRLLDFVDDWRPETGWDVERAVRRALHAYEAEDREAGLPIPEGVTR